MFGWLARQFRPGTDKAPRSATLTTFLGPGGRGTAPVLDAAEAMRHNAGWAFSAVRAISHRLAGQPVKVGWSSSRRSPGKSKSGTAAPTWCRTGTVDVLDDHPLIDALASPNPYLVSFSLLALTVAALQLCGLAFWWVDEQPDGSIRLWYLPPSWVRDDVEAPEPFTRFKVRPANGMEEFTLTNAELIRFSTPDPGNPLSSLSPLQANALAVLTDEHISVTQFSAFKNGMMPGLLVRVGKVPELAGIGGEKPALTIEQRANLTAALKRMYSGSWASGEPVIADAVIEDVKPITSSPREMDFTGSSALTKEKILMGFGVNGIVLGQVESANRASAATADETFVYATVNPLGVLISQHLTRWFSVFFGEADLVVWVEPCKPRDPDGRRADLAQLAWAGAVTLNELRAEHGLPPIDGGDVFVKPRADPTADRPSSGKGAGSWWDLLDPAEQHDVYNRSIASRNGFHGN